MAFEWVDYLTLAQWLRLNPQVANVEEAALRSVISRAYYAAFSAAREVAQDRDGLRFRRDENAHRTIADHFRGDTDPTRKDIGHRLVSLRIARNTADYDKVLKGNLKGQALQSVEDAQVVLSLLKSL